MRNKIEQKILEKNLKKYILKEEQETKINLYLLRSDARSLDKDLLMFLYEEFSEEFFKPINAEVLVFDKEKFLDFISFKNFLSDSYTSFANKIGLATLDKKRLSQNTEVVLNFPFKDCVLEGSAKNDNEKKKEIFFNQTLASDEIDMLFSPKALQGFETITLENSNLVCQKDIAKILDTFAKQKDNSTPPPTESFNQRQ